MARPLKPFIRGGGFYPSRRWTPLVYPGGYTTANGGGQPEPEAVLKTVTGSLIHITDALALPAEALSVNVEPIQDLHGQASPYPAGGGPNKLPPLTSATISGVTITVADDGTVTINGTASTDAYFDCNFTANITSGVTFYFCAFNPVASTSNRLTVFLITDNGNPQINLNTANAIYSSQFSADTTASKWRLRVPSGVTYSNFVVKPMLQVGGTAPAAYAPYSNICPISGRTSATVTRTGKNLFDKTDTAKQIVNSYFATNTTITSGSGRMVVWVPCKPNTTYTIHRDIAEGESQIRFAVGTTEELPALGVLVSQYVGNTQLSYTITTSATAKYLVVWAYWANNTQALDSLVIEIGSTASAYEPYAGNTYTIALGDTVYGGTLDVTGGKMVVDRAMATLTGSEVWYEYTFFQGFYTRLGGMRKGTRQDGISNMLVAFNTSTSGQKNTMWLGVDNQYFFAIGVYETMGSTLADFKSYLATNNLQVVYPLATPIEITLTPTQIDMLLGENNLWSDAGDSTLTYYADGNASTSEALGILLGGTYNNPGGADDVSDDEALGILLGGS